MCCRSHATPMNTIITTLSLDYMFRTTPSFMSAGEILVAETNLKCRWLWESILPNAFPPSELSPECGHAPASCATLQEKNERIKFENTIQLCQGGAHRCVNRWTIKACTGCFFSHLFSVFFPSFPPHLLFFLSSTLSFFLLFLHSGYINGCDYGCVDQPITVPSFSIHEKIFVPLPKSKKRRS